jgi:hypothetical protein
VTGSLLPSVVLNRDPRLGLPWMGKAGEAHSLPRTRGRYRIAWHFRQRWSYERLARGTQLMLGWKLAPTSSNPLNFVASSTNTEALWNECCIFGGGNCVTGGGTSVFFGAPSWQNGQASINGGKRSIPDLSWNAAVNGGVLIYTTQYPAVLRQSWHIEGGTSAASPQMAGLAALANQARTAAGKAPLGLLGPHIYALGDADASQPDASFDGNGVSFFREIVPQVFKVGPLNPRGSAVTSGAALDFVAGTEPQAMAGRV